MFLAGSLALLIAAAPRTELEGLGLSGSTPQEAIALRTSLRWRAGLGATAILGLGNYSVAGGVGLTVDGGFIVNDRLSVFAHAEGGLGPFNLIGSLGVIGEYLVGERLSLGLGLAFTLWVPTPLFSASYSDGSFYGITLPLRINYALSDRGPGSRRRMGWILGLQLAPGLSVEPDYYYQLSAPLGPRPGLSATFTIGYAWW